MIRDFAALTSSLSKDKRALNASNMIVVIEKFNVEKDAKKKDFGFQKTIQDISLGK